MPYKGKIAWLSLLAMALTFGPYFLLVATRSGQAPPMPDLQQLGRFALVVAGQVLILGIGHLILRRGSPVEARTPPDERDQAIARRSVNAAYYVLISGMIVVGCVMPFSTGGWAIVNAALAMIVIAELVHYGVVAGSYRRQA